MTPPPRKMLFPAHKEEQMACKHDHTDTLAVAISAVASQRSDTSINKGDRKNVPRGTLRGEKQVGFFTLGIADFGYAGCTTKTTSIRR